MQNRISVFRSPENTSSDVTVTTTITNSLGMSSGTISSIASFYTEPYFLVANSLGSIIKYKLDSKNDRIVWIKEKEYKHTNIVTKMILDETFDILFFIDVTQNGLYALSLEDLIPIPFKDESENLAISNGIFSYDIFNFAIDLEHHRLIFQLQDKRTFCFSYTQNHLLDTSCRPDFGYTLKGLMTTIHLSGDLLLCQFQEEDKIHVYHVLSKIYHKIQHSLVASQFVFLYSIDRNDYIYLSNNVTNEMVYINGVKTGVSTLRNQMNPFKIHSFTFDNVLTQLCYSYPYVVGLGKNEKSTLVEFKNLMGNYPNTIIELGNLVFLQASKDYFFVASKARVYVLIPKKESFDQVFERTLFDIGKHKLISRRHFLGKSLGMKKNPECFVSYLECLKAMVSIKSKQLDEILMEIQSILVEFPSLQKGLVKKFLEGSISILGQNAIVLLQRKDQDYVMNPHYFISFLNTETTCLYIKYLIDVEKITCDKFIRLYLVTLIKLSDNETYLGYFVELLNLVSRTLQEYAISELKKQSGDKLTRLAEHPILKGWIQYPPGVLEEEYASYLISTGEKDKPELTRQEKIDLIKSKRSMSKTNSFSFSGIGKKIMYLSSKFQKKPTTPPILAPVSSFRNKVEPKKQTMSDEEFSKQWQQYLIDKSVDDKTAQIMNALTREKKISLLELDQNYSNVVKNTKVQDKPVEGGDLKQKIAIYGKQSTYASVEKKISIIHNTTTKVKTTQSNLSEKELDVDFKDYLFDKGLDLATQEIMLKFPREKKLLLLEAYKKEAKDHKISRPKMIEKKNIGLEVTEEELNSKMISYMDKNGIDDAKTRTMMLSFPKEKKHLLLQNFVDTPVKTNTFIEFDKFFTGYNVNFNSIFSELKEAFHKNLEKEANVEPFDFVLDLNAIPNEISEEAIAKFQTICDDYIDASSKKEINIGGTERQRVMLIRRECVDVNSWVLPETPVEVLAVIRKNIVRDLKYDSFPRFISSPYGHQVITNLQNNPMVISKDPSYLIFDKLKQFLKDNDRDLLEMSHSLSDSEAILAKYFSNPLQSIYLVFPTVESKKKTFSNHTCGLLIDNILLEWNDTELCVPRVTNEIMLSFDLNHQVNQETLNNLALVISHWNQKKGYQTEGINKTKFGNAQDFVDAVLFSIGVKPVIYSHVEQMCRNIREKGHTKIGFFMNSEFCKKFGQKKPMYHLETHEKLDIFYANLIQMDPKFGEIYASDFQYLSVVDAMFWKLHQSLEKEDFKAIYQPRREGCPFAK